MKKAMGLVEILIVIIIVAVLYFAFFNSPTGRKDPFEEQKEIKTKQELIDNKLKDIQSKKDIKNRIEQNLNRENY